MPQDNTKPTSLLSRSISAILETRAQSSSPTKSPSRSSLNSGHRSIIDKAGAFPVTQVPVRHLSELVNMGSPRCGVLHTTEGHFADGKAILTKRYAPHFMLGFNEQSKKAEILQFVPVGFIGAALKKHNDLAIVQIEMVGFSEETAWLPGTTAKNPHPQTLEALCSLMLVCQNEWGIPLSHPWPDDDWGKAGFNTPHRASGKFGNTAGWFGHQDVPLNDHWDVGHMQWSKVFARCAELAASAPQA